MRSCGLVALLLTLFACKESGITATVSKRETVTGSTYQIGDTIFVENSCSVWSAPARVNEDLAIGALTGADNQIFGYVEGIAVDPEGGIYVADSKRLAIRHFDSTGRFIRTVGRPGKGPGEYSGIQAIAVRRDGTLIVRDGQNARLTLYGPTGELVTIWPLNTSNAFGPGQVLVIDSSDAIYVKVLRKVVQLGREGGMFFRLPQLEKGSTLVRLDSAGRMIDSLIPPAILNEPEPMRTEFDPASMTVWSTNGYFISGVNSRYSFDVVRSGNPRRRISLAWTPLRFAPEERAEYAAIREWSKKNEPWVSEKDRIPLPPETKPAYHAIYVGADGRIWVHRLVKATKHDVEPVMVGNIQLPTRSWKEPTTTFDVFEEDGTYLAEVELPGDVKPMVFGRDHIWGTRAGREGET
jgi:hypothetical protein